MRAARFALTEAEHIDPAGVRLAEALRAVVYDESRPTEVAVVLFAAGLRDIITAAPQIAARMGAQPTAELIAHAGTCASPVVLLGVIVSEHPDSAYLPDPSDGHVEVVDL